MNSEHYISKFRLYFLFSIDLAHFIDQDTSKHILRARSDRKIYEEVLNLKHINPDFCNSGKLEDDLIEQRANDSLDEGGKNIWSYLFLKKYAPILFEENKSEYLTESLKVSHQNAIKGNELALEKISNDIVVYKNCEFRIFREGILSASFQFSSIGSDATFLSVKDFITVLSQLRRHCEKAFKRKVIRFLKSLKNREYLSDNFRINKDLRVETIEKSTWLHGNNHLVIFLDSLYKREEDGTFIIDSSKKKNEAYKKNVFGLLNQPKWYKKYGKEYINKAFDKNVGYRTDELYITDNNCTLIILQDYWDQSKPLKYYRRDLVLLIEYILSRISILDYLNSIIHDSEISKGGSIVNDDVESIVLIRNILFALEESLDVATLVKHGFTRKFLEQLKVERYIKNQIDSVGRFIENLDRAVTLKANFNIAKTSNKFARISFWVALVLLFLSILALSITHRTLKSSEESTKIQYQMLEQLNEIKKTSVTIQNDLNKLKFDPKTLKVDPKHEEKGKNNTSPKSSLEKNKE